MSYYIFYDVIVNTFGLLPRYAGGISFIHYQQISNGIGTAFLDTQGVFELIYYPWLQILPIIEPY